MGIYRLIIYLCYKISVSLFLVLKKILEFILGIRIESIPANKQKK